MLNYNFISLRSQLESNKDKVILFGAGDVGELVSYSLNKIGVTVDFFCDNDEKKHGKKYFGIDVISPEDLKKLGKNVKIFISNNYVSTINSQLTKAGFDKIFNCAELLKNTDFSDSKQITGLQPLKIERRIEYYRNMCLKEEYTSSGILNIKSLDVQITERCSLRCKNCSNLMQYYEKPVNSDLEQLFLAMDRFMSCVKKIYELGYNLSTLRPDYLSNSIIYLSIISFYLLPFFWSEKNKNKYKNLILNRKKILLFFSLIVISIFFYSDIERFGLGGGAILKLSKVIGFNFLFLISAILGILLINYYYENLSGLLTIILLFLSYPFSILYQKYFDPTLILFFLILSGSKILQDNLEKNRFNIKVLYFYFGAFLFATNYYYYLNN